MRVRSSSCGSSDNKPTQNRQQRRRKEDMRHTAPALQHSKLCTGSTLTSPPSQAHSSRLLSLSQWPSPGDRRNGMQKNQGNEAMVFHHTREEIFFRVTVSNAPSGLSFRVGYDLEQISDSRIVLKLLR